MLLIKSANFAALIAVSMLPLMPSSASSQDKQTIRVVVPFPKGGGSDTLVRLAAQHIANEQRRTMEVENYSGADALAAIENVARAAPDGNTALIVANSFVISPILKRINYDPLSNFKSVCLLTRSPNVIVVNSKSEFNSLSDLIVAARASPGQLTMAFQGHGSSQHIGYEKLKRSAKVDIAQAPFPGVTPAVNAVLGGQAASLFIAYPAVMELVKAGRLRVLTVASQARVESLPDVPTIIEAGFNIDEDVWFGIMVPAGTPEDKIMLLAQWFTAAMMSHDVKSKLAVLEIHPVGLCGSEFAIYLKNQHETYSRVIQEANIALQ